jgi:hypothetical protein
MDPILLLSIIYHSAYSEGPSNTDIELSPTIEIYFFMGYKVIRNIPLPVALGSMIVAPR